MTAEIFIQTISIVVGPVSVLAVHTGHQFHCLNSGVIYKTAPSKGVSSRIVL
jgi:hypothetical protein